MSSREVVHLGDAIIGFKLVRMAAEDPGQLRRHLREATDTELIGLAAHIVTLQDCAEDVRKEFAEEKERRGHPPEKAE